MLIGLDPLLTPDLLQTLAAMGHGDQIALVDANFPADARATRLVSMPGADLVPVLKAVLSLLPIDTFEPGATKVMRVVGQPDEKPPVIMEIKAALRENGAPDTIGLDRHAFYAAAEAAYAIVQTGERRFYGNVILTKGVIPPPETRE